MIWLILSISMFLIGMFLFINGVSKNYEISGGVGGILSLIFGFASLFNVATIPSNISDMKDLVKERVAIQVLEKEFSDLKSLYIKNDKQIDTANLEYTKTLIELGTKIAERKSELKALEEDYKFQLKHKMRYNTIGYDTSIIYAE